MNMTKLTDMDLTVLEHLPVEPNGLSLAELVDGLTAGPDKDRRRLVRASIKRLIQALGGLSTRREDDSLGNRNVILYGVRRAAMPAVRRHFAGRAGK